MLINNIVKEFLKNKNEFSDDKYAALLSKSRDKNISLIQEVIHQGYSNPTDIYKFIADELRIPFMDLQNFKPNYKIITLLPESYARHCQAIILEESAGSLLIGMSDPTNISLQDEIKQQLKIPISFALVQSEHLKQLFDLVYRNSKEMTSLAEELHDELDSFKIEFNAGSDVIGQVDAPVVKLLYTIFEDALRIQASDIHLEPCKDGLRIRLRVDGVLQEQIMPEKSIIAALSQRLKLMARLDISEKNKPQDGRFTINTDKKKIDVRLSTLPMNGGESVVMRLLTNSTDDLSLDDMGMDKDILHKFRQLISLPHGIILVTGPTGSGKTTTLYAALGELDAIKEKIMTIEDPIERELTNIVQTQVLTKIGLNFSDVLRSSLRQDPDIIMVGEIRDEETAEIAMRAALTGHLVFSTLHTNDSTSTAIRLLDMGIKGFLLADALFGVLAQRLARKICPQCKAIYTPTASELELLDTIREGARNHTFYYGQGCQYCYHSGYKGRIGIYELLIFNQDIRDALRTNNLEKYQEYASKELENKLLGDQILDKAIEGLTTLSELRAITGGDIT